MKDPVLKPSGIEHLSGSVESVTFYHEETGFCVLRAKVKNYRDLVTIIGKTSSVAKGECIQASGTWVHNKKYGVQFKARELIVILPSSEAGIEKYLGSGMIKGIGPHFAKKLVQAFGAAVFEVIDQTPEQLNQVTGIGKKRKACILNAWEEQKSVRDIIAFLQTHGIGTTRAVRIYKTYGKHAMELIRSNPYRLALDIHGIGFQTADSLAMNMGISKDSCLRAQAGLYHVLHRICGEGHCAASLEHLITVSSTLLEIAVPIIEQAIAQERQQGKLILDAIRTVPCIFLSFFYEAELKIAQSLLRIQAYASLPWGQLDTISAIEWVEQETHFTLSASQKIAINTVLQNKLSIITGGPGVGKTTLINSILKIVLAKKISVALCAPTGRAAKRLMETTGLTAKTIHRLLAFDFKTGRFQYNQSRLLPIQLLIIDEVSMLDVMCSYHLLTALPREAALIFVGDSNQLPAVGSGAVLSDMIRSGRIETVQLTEIFRQVAHSSIVANAHRIQQGRMPLMSSHVVGDFYTVYTDTPEAAQEQLIQLVTERIPSHLRCHPIHDIQVLTPMNKGNLGSYALNILLQKKLNGLSEPKVMRYGMTFAPGDKVIQIVNNYQKEVFNGDIGIISRMNLEDSLIYITFDRRERIYDYHELDEVRLSYAITIHKSQGSEFPVVVIPIVMQHYTLLARNLLYTAVTRGKRLVVLVGQKQAVGMAVRHHPSTERLTQLAERLVV